MKKVLLIILVLLIFYIVVSAVALKISPSCPAWCPKVAVPYSGDLPAMTEECRCFLFK